MNEFEIKVLPKDSSSKGHESLGSSCRVISKPNTITLVWHVWLLLFYCVSMTVYASIVYSCGHTGDRFAVVPPSLWLLLS
ncbi:hypothetical protein LY76DRAFT_60539 [Colletotrichum caudatum]|nr:hypothetical protein LY76DRAFT_60539 [Colletotrichum caudatum]